jgi:hypothetical protein
MRKQVFHCYCKEVLFCRVYISRFLRFLQDQDGEADIRTVFSFDGPFFHSTHHSGTWFFSHGDGRKDIKMGDQRWGGME